jgi:hypothetical protein
MEELSLKLIQKNTILIESEAIRLNINSKFCKNEKYSFFIK